MELPPQGRARRRRFQADYHLKELSMGEHDQPVIGMRSCFDFARTSDFEEGWSAREWFVVRQAEIHVSEDGVVVPYLRMGVEAREQTLGADGALEDAPLTRPDHPLVRYAEAFTRNFDLIAERKSVVAQLREVAKASVVAKFLLESGVQLDDRWLSLCSPSGLGCCLEVPLLWSALVVVASSTVHQAVILGKQRRIRVTMLTVLMRTSAFEAHQWITLATASILVALQVQTDGIYDAEHHFD